MNRSTSNQNSAGFSLLEIIMVLLLIGIVGALTTPVFTTVIQGTVAGGVEQQTADEAYWATSRMTSIIGLATNLTISGSSVTVTAPDGTDNTFTHSGTTIFYGPGSSPVNSPLFWDQVNTFNNLNYANGLFHADVKLVDASHPTISLDIHVRNAQ